MRHAVFSTTAGWMGIRATDLGLTGIVLPRSSRESVVGELGIDTGFKDDASLFDDLITRFRRYFQGEVTDFPDKLDLSGTTPFKQAVWLAAQRIPYGQTSSYAEVARQAGKPGAARAAGGALGKNPLLIIIPCHRVISADGSLGGFTGGLDIKRRLLDMESGIRSGSVSSATRPSL